MNENDQAAPPPASDDAGAGALIEDWPLRPWVLAALLALCGLVIHLLTDMRTEDGGYMRWDDIPWRVAAVSFTWFGGLALAFTLNLRRLIEAAIFAAVIGLIMGGIAWHVVYSDGQRAAVELSFASGVFFSLLALPLFQAGFHRKRFATDYRDTHFHVWSDVISGAGAIAFVGISWSLLYLIDSLFELVGITFIGDVMREEWFWWVWSGGIGGAALGVLLNNLKIIGALQRVVMLVFALLAVPFAAAIVVFLIVLIASGGQALWDATDDATPILLSCAAACFVFFNTIIRDSDEERSANRVMQIAAAVLAACILPLTAFAALSMGIRIEQYGLAPERIWGLIAIAIATAYGLACLVALIRGRVSGWSRQLRLANLNLAVGACVVAFLLSLPLFDFGGVSARNQVARLEAGKVTPEEFDFAALKFDFGASGEAVLAELAAGEDEVATLAAEAQALEERPYRWAGEERAEPLAFHTQPADPELEAILRPVFEANEHFCRDYCIATERSRDDEGRRQILLIERWHLQWFLIDENYKIVQGTNAQLGVNNVPQLGPETQIEIREVAQERVFVDGVMMDEPLFAPVTDMKRPVVGNAKHMATGPETTDADTE